MKARQERSLRVLVLDGVHQSHVDHAPDALTVAAHHRMSEEISNDDGHTRRRRAFDEGHPSLTGCRKAPTFPAMFRAVQKGILNGFEYRFLQDGHHEVGKLSWPDFALAKNARLKGLVPKSFSTSLKMEWKDRPYVIDFEYLNRAWENDIRFTLKDGERELAVAEVKQQQSGRPEIRVVSPFNGQLSRKRGLFRATYRVDQNGQEIGSISEASLFTLKRELIVDLPTSIEEPVQCFLCFLMINHAFR